MRDLGRTIWHSKLAFTWKQADTTRLFPVLCKYSLQTGAKLPWPANQVAALHVKGVTMFALSHANRSAPGNAGRPRNVRPRSRPATHSRIASAARAATSSGRSTFKAGAAGFIRTKGRAQYRFSLHRSFAKAISARIGLVPPPPGAISAPATFCAAEATPTPAPICTRSRADLRTPPGRSWRSRIPTFES